MTVDGSMMEEATGSTLDSLQEKTPPRLLITKMELENFKSYAGVKEIGPFHKCFSAVVGPNGSGKSNVIDAMLFVFGKRASKLRLKKVSELIHKSDAVRQNPPSFARVSVFFQDIIDTGPGDNDYIVVPGTDTVVTRIARSDNSSTYKMDGKNCQLKDVATYLESKGIDLDNNRFLILQGEVEMISMMQPKGKTDGDEGLLEYLEDIIGSSKYVQETEEAALAVETLTEQRQEKLNRVKAVEKEKDALEAAKQEAEALLTKEREIRSKQNILFQLSVSKYSNELEKYTERKAVVEEKLAVEREHLQGADARVAELENGLRQQKKDYDKVHSELTKTKEEFAAYERRDIKLREEIKHNKTLKKKLESKVKQQIEKKADCQKKANEADESVPLLELDIFNWTNSKAKEDAALEEVYQSMKGVTEKLRSELEDKTQKLAPINQERVVYQAALDTATTEVSLLQNGVLHAQEKLQQAEFELANLDQTQESKRRELASAEDNLVQSNTRIVEANAEEAHLANLEGEMSKRYTHVMAQLESAQAALQSENDSRVSAAVQGILKAARKDGELSKAGVLGRLGDLATIPDKYDVAISTACGHVNSIVVQTTAGAEQCLKYAHKYKLGRVTCIPMDKTKKGAHDRVVETPEGAPRLYDLINPAKPFLAPAFFLAISDTLVAPDIDTANRWAFDSGKRWRVVTLDGKLFETSGTMSGGGTRVNRGGMRLASGRSKMALVGEEDDFAAEVKRFQEEAATVQEELIVCRKTRKDLVDEIRLLRKTVKILEAKLPKLTVEIDGCDTTRKELTKFVPELRTQVKLSDEDEAKLSELNKKVAMCKTDMSSCAMKASKLEAEIARLQRAIMDAGGAKLKKQQDACEKALSALDAAEKALSSAKVNATSNSKGAEKAEKSRVAAEAERSACVTVIDNLLAEFTLLEADALKVMQVYEQAKSVESEAKQSLEEASRECEEIKKSQSEQKCVEVELVGKLEDIIKQVAECERKKEKWDGELSKLRVIAEDDDFDEDIMETGDNVMGNELSTAGDVDDVAVEDGGENDVNRKQTAETMPLPRLPVYSLEALECFNKDDVMKDIAVLEAERSTIAKNANMGAIAEYRKKEADYLSRVFDLDGVTEERNSARKKHEDLRRLRLDMFMEGFGQITLKLKEMYQMITLGGDAELELVDSLDPFSEGIVFSVRPPKKSWKNISNLSGGEKTLSSLALVFALHHFKPTPLYVMDEIDAALDFKNVSIVANYIKERTRNAQFVIISLRNNMFELADRLVGIYKTENCTKSVSINPRAYGFNQSQNGGVPSTPGLSERNTNSRHQALHEKVTTPTTIVSVQTTTENSKE